MTDSKRPGLHMPPNKLRSVGLASELMRAHYLELHEASKSGGRKTAWCSSVGPAELLRAMGFLVYFPENHAAMLAASRRANDVMRAANRIGYSPDICAYLRSDIGAFIEGKTSLGSISPEISAPPRPDVLVYNTNQCRDVKDWFSWYARHFDVPCIGVEGPCNVDEVTPEHVSSVSLQLEALVPELSRISGHALDPDELARAVELSRDCSRGWGEALSRAAHSPSPLSFFHGLLLMGPAVVARGTREAVLFHERLIEELDSRIENNIAAVGGERHRLYWEGMPVWGRVSRLTRLFADLRACVVASTYCNSWVLDSLSPDDPFDSMARAYTELFIVRSDAAKEAYIEKMAKLYRVDGIVFHDARTCASNSNSRYGMPERLALKLGIPCTVISADHVDTGLYDDDRISIQIDAFVEQLERR